MGVFDILNGEILYTLGVDYGVVMQKISCRPAGDKQVVFEDC